MHARRDQWNIREGRDEDTASILAMVGMVFAEYGCRLDPELDAPAQYQPETGFFNFGGALFVAETETSIVGSIGIIAKKEQSHAQLRAFYLNRSYRGSGLAMTLLDHVLGWCKRNEIEAIDLWTDSRFERSHAFYSKIGFRRSGLIRRYGDVNKTTGLHFETRVIEIISNLSRLSKRQIRIGENETHSR